MFTFEGDFIKDGYSINVFINGKPTTLKNLYYLPYFEPSKIPAFMTTGTNALWALLIEKAYSKIIGSYSDIIMKTAVDLFNFISPFPTKQLIHEEYKGEKKSFFWNYLHTSIANEYWVTTISGNSKEVSELGLNKKFTYSIASLHQISVDGTMHRVIKLSGLPQNKKFLGKWSDESTFWTDDVKNQVDFDSKSLGQIYISFEELLDHFLETTICLHAPEFRYIEHINISQSIDQFHIIRFENLQPSDMIFKVHQQEDKVFNTRFILAVDYEDDRFDIDLLHMDGRFLKGEPVSFIESSEEYTSGYVFFQVDAEQTDFCFSIFSTSQMTTKILDKSQTPQFLEKVLKSYMLFKQSSYRCVDSEPDIKIKSYTGLHCGGYGCHYYENDSKNETIYLENFRYENRKEIEYCFDHDENTDYVCVKTAPSQTNMRIIK